MFRSAIVFVALLACVFAKTVPTLNFDVVNLESTNNRILNGSNAVSGQFPYVASLRTAANVHFCGATIISNRVVLTSAQCTVGRTTAAVRVVVGTHLLNSGGVSHTVNRIVNHPSYVANTYANDVAIVETVAVMSFTNLVSSIPMGTTFVNVTNAIVTGWGQTAYPTGAQANNLQFLNTNTLTNTDCSNRHTANNRPLLFDHKLCTFSMNGQGNCMGDAGGPLVSGGVVIGTVSWIIPCGVGYPDVYDRVASHRTWILSVM